MQYSNIVFSLTVLVGWNNLLKMIYMQVTVSLQGTTSVASNLLKATSDSSSVTSCWLNKGKGKKNENDIQSHTHTRQYTGK